MVYKVLSCSPKILSGLLRRFTQHFIFSLQTDKFEGCTFNITVYCGDCCAMESQTGVERFNKIIHFVPFEPGTTDRGKPAEFISTVRGLKI